QPIEARRLLEADKVPEGESGWIRGRAVAAVVKATVAFDPEAAHRLALTAPPGFRLEALAHAAGGIKHDPALRAKRFAAATTGNPGYERTGVLLVVAAIADETAPDVARTLRQELREAVSSKSDSFGGGGAPLARVLLPEVPGLCRRVLELGMKDQRRINPGHADDYGMLRRELRALALLDPDRALQLAGELKQKDATFRMKTDLVLLLLTPPHKRLALLSRDQ
ncbi:MAG: hypothetical protein H7145_21250, partial [Akkermansiaceae bacterium]|nr:hypothetical protein [Armatimonadota bacterium]